MARVLVTGVTGQIGSFAADLLVDGGHTVLGVPGRGARPPPAGVLMGASPLTPEGVGAVLDEAGDIDAIVHLAGRSSVATSWSDPLGTFDANARLTTALLFALTRRTRGVRFVHASSAEIFGNAPTPLLDEGTPLSPISPYAVSKAAGHMAVQVAREGLGAPASNLVFCLGESPRRAVDFVFRKITRTVAAIALGNAEHLVLGDTTLVRDFCHAKDLARAAVLIALGDDPGDYVCGSGEGRSILEVARAACDVAGVDAARAIRFDPSLVRPNDIARLVGDAGKLRARGWAPSMGLRELLAEVYAFDLEDARRARPPRTHPRADGAG